MKTSRQDLTGPWHDPEGEKAMRAEIESRKDLNAGICRRYRVTRLELFGSAARGKPTLRLRYAGSSKPFRPVAPSVPVGGQPHCLAFEAGCQFTGKPWRVL